MGAELFLNTLYHAKPASDHILIWEKRPDRKVSYWFDHVSDAVKRFQTHGSKQDTYVGCGTSAKELPQFRRCKAEEISGIPAAWIDVDILDPVHSKTNLPETALKAMEVIEGFPLKPTIIVHSGHGYQFWWVFKKFISFNNARNHEDAADLLHQFTWTMRDAARSMGYDLDMTFDLSRVFRIPGGQNFKDTPPLPVTMEHCGTNFCTPSELKAAIDTFRLMLGNDATPIGDRKRTVATVATAMQGNVFTLDPMAEPPKDKFDMLMELEPKFVASWTRKAKFPSGDESPSAYDMSLASLACAAEWEPQEIVNMLIAFRRYHGLPLKMVESYYQRTLVRASTVTDTKKAFTSLGEMVIDRSLAPVADPKTITEQTIKTREVNVAAAKENLSRILRVKILRVLRYNIDPAEYRLETEAGDVHIGQIQNLIEQTYFRRKLAEATGVYSDPMKSQNWSVVAQALLDICELVSAGEDTSPDGLIRHWVTNYLEQHQPIYDMAQGFLTRRPFYHGNSLYITGPELRNYISMYWKEVLNSKAMGIMLRNYGCTSVVLNVNYDNRWVTRSAWKFEIAKNDIARSFLDPEMLEEANRARQKPDTKASCDDYHDDDDVSFNKPKEGAACAH